MDFHADAVVVGAGLAGLVATYELTRAGRRVLVIEQESRANLGGQAFWSLGGLFLVDSPEQRRMGIRDSPELAWQDWQGTARFGDGDGWGRRWAEAYVDWAAGGKRDYLHGLGWRALPFVGWAERGDGSATGHGNSVPRFHLTWGTGPRVVEIFAAPVLEAERGGLVKFAFRHRVDALLTEGTDVVGVRGSVLADDPAPRAVASSREVVGEFEARGAAVVVTSGGIGGDLDAMREAWPVDRLGPAPRHLISGVPAHVDGRLIGVAERAGASVVNRDRLWAYTEGIHDWNPVWPHHGIRILPGPSSMWFDATGRRLAGQSGVPGADTLGAMRQILATGFDHSWFVLTQTIIEKEFALSGSEQNPDITGRDLGLLVRSRLAKGAPGPVERFKERGEDFVVADTLPQLVAGMNAISRATPLDPAALEAQIVARDREVANPFSKDIGVMMIHNARRSRTDRLIRVAPPHRILDPAHGPLIAVRLNILSRKALGGILTDLDSRVLRADGAAVGGLFAAGEAAGFGGGGVHGQGALEGTFLGGCIFSGRAAGWAAAAG
ncbi:FAD-binding dehydrogenase [Tessaracoccus palaemonis]|uniref:FAD-binding dehydrogenase n=1 Tax=Tessaracoccus palaemonis TaxID=2829499 RepID=A0ABX8SRD5_9ACTN|nr:FAD-binding dehydrogenase [Tessaracoccus palaemonis]QXT63734.1 FAD-binding dehydrogenase [Tessaracoccus palaemonis]